MTPRLDIPRDHFLSGVYTPTNRQRARDVMQGATLFQAYSHADIFDQAAVRTARMEWEGWQEIVAAGDPRHPMANAARALAMAAFDAAMCVTEGKPFTHETQHGDDD